MPTIPLPVIADVYRCSFNWTWTGGGMNAVNVMHIKALTTGTDVTAAWGAINTAWTLNQLQASITGAIITTVDIIPLDGHSGTSTFSTGSGSKWAGAQTGDPLIAPAVIIKIATGVRGRSNRGRVFLPFIGEAATGAGSLTSTTIISAMQTAWSAFNEGLAGYTEPFSLGVAAYDRKNSGASAHFTEATAVTLETVLGTQRRRQSRLR